MGEGGGGYWKAGVNGGWVGGQEGRASYRSMPLDLFAASSGLLESLSATSSWVSESACLISSRSILWLWAYRGAC